jgi:sugar diacid utilization regulator
MSALLGLTALLRLPAILLLTTIFVAHGVAQQIPAAELQRQADEAKGADCVHLNMAVARRSLEDGAKLFNAGDMQGARSAVDLSLHYAQRSVDCAVEAHKAEKSAEIELRRLTRRLDEIGRTVESEERQHIAQSISEFDKQRDRLLKALFGSDAGGAAGPHP